MYIYICYVICENGYLTTCFSWGLLCRIPRDWLATRAQGIRHDRPNGSYNMAPAAILAQVM